MTTQDLTSTAANKELVLAALTHNGATEAIAALDRYYAPEFIRHGDKREYDRESLKAGLNSLYGGFPDLVRQQFDLVADGDRVAYRWEATGTHLGEYMGVRATGKPIRATGMVMCRIADGLIVEEWGSWNKVSLLHDLGIIPIGR